MPDDPAEPKGWEISNKGRAVRAFAAAQEKAALEGVREGDGSKMVQQDAPRPRPAPPRLGGAAVDRAVYTARLTQERKDENTKIGKKDAIRAFAEEILRQKAAKDLELKNENTKGDDR